MTLQRALGKLGRFSWTLHNVLAHPLSEILFQLGFASAGNRIHDLTVPQYDAPTPGRG